ncbi:Glutathione S-transferase zeta-1 [Dionaea muscipula]
MADENQKQKLKLYSSWISSCSFRVHIALNLKRLKYEYKAVNEEEHLSPEFKDLNPLGYVPVLVDDDFVLGDSLAILMYLEEKYPQRPMLPKDLHKRVINYQAANIVSSSIQPMHLQNLAVLKYWEAKISPDEKSSWTKYHIKQGFTALEKLLKDCAGRYAIGDEVGLADVFLAPQLDAAIRRFNVDMSDFPLLKRLYDAYLELPEVQDAMPEKQPDAPHNTAF